MSRQVTWYILEIIHQFRFSSRFSFAPLGAKPGIICHTFLLWFFKIILLANAVLTRYCTPSMSDLLSGFKPPDAFWLVGFCGLQVDVLPGPGVTVL